MNHLEELKEFARLHARGQGMTERQVAAVLPWITTDEPGHPGSWARVWTAEADRLAFAGRPIDACRRYALARFPHHGDDDRVRAQHNCVRTFDDWRRRRGIERLVLDHPGGTVAAWTAGLDGGRRRPLVVIMGGIVSVKEQWAPLLPKLARLGYAAIATEMPGVGENTLRYRADSWELFPHLLDRLGDRARVTQTSVLGLSFSGHLALRAAAVDSRIRSVHTVGAPVADFFTDPLWWPRVPGITRETLRRLTGVADQDELRTVLADFALDAATLESVRVPVNYVVSKRDEIIPAGERELLARTLPRVRFKEFDDVHGSPAHLGALRSWLIASLVRVRIEESAGRAGRSRRAAERVAAPRGATAPTAGPQHPVARSSGRSPSATPGS
ncbi:alpha/beta fold hydrolase [Streptomyces sp. NPDC005963]|uniref:alpha/beta fold hydrolase n=1 Tax=Streptomyces sp. NPDC005963 TaxID=3156721 RepID=UPI0033C910E0